MATRPSAKYSCNLGGSFFDFGATKYIFRAPADAYDNIGDDLGISKVTDQTFGVGKNREFSPAKVRITYVAFPATSERPQILRSTVRYCDPGKFEEVVVSNKMNNQRIKVNGKEYEINNVGRAK